MLQYQPFTSSIDISFWQKLSSLKIGEFKLDTSPVSLYGYYSTSSHQDIPARLNLVENSFSEEQLRQHLPHCSAVYSGTLLNSNTLEAFKLFDKNTILSGVCNEIWSHICSGYALEHPECLSKFILLSYADLKKHLFYYWCGFPALTSPLFTVSNNDSIPLVELFSNEQLFDFFDNIQKLGNELPPCFLYDEKSQIIAPLAEFQKYSNPFLCFIDPCGLEENPGWPLRNILLLVAHTWGTAKLNVIAFRDIATTNQNSSKSVVFKLSLNYAHSETFSSIGWERNARGKMGPRVVDLSVFLDPKRLAEDSVNLNLELMRWRILPSLKLEQLRDTKCLLLGAGTLGCNVARNLMSWGVRNITLVDNGKVSFSNPVRQSLFFFDDCLDGGKPKAIAAAECLKRIFPGINARGIQLSIPMAGHAVCTASEKDQVQNALKELKDLIDEHDVVFLLTDSRESRWLPSVISAASNKLLINVALGFDSYVTMRHGVTQEERLGCYFCNDVVAPRDSLTDRTLDQMCTVTRPGLAHIASALAIELFVCLLHHPLGASAPAPIKNEMNSILGLVPHQIRGELASFSQMHLAGFASSYCTACSPKIVESFKKDSRAFLLNALNDLSFLENLSGLTQLKEITENVDIDWDEEEYDM